MYIFRQLLLELNLFVGLMEVKNSVFSALLATQQKYKVAKA